MESFPNRRHRLHVEHLEPRRMLATFTVNTTIDFDDQNQSTMSLRDAIILANALPDADVINFNIPGAGPHTIAVGGSGLSGLPTITSPVTINGYSQTGASANTNSIDLPSNAVILIQLDGVDAGAAAGLSVSSANVAIRGLSITRFSGNGVNLLNANTVTVTGNFIGIGADGVTPGGNGPNGVLIGGEGGFNIVIGGATPQARNVIANNTQYGIRLDAGNSSNSVFGNTIGANAQNALQSNGLGGLGVFASLNQIGGVGAGQANSIRAGGTSAGVVVGSSFAVGNPIRGNQITVGSGLGIDLSTALAANGRTLNDPAIGSGTDDIDGSANLLQNFPEFTSGPAILNPMSGELVVSLRVPSNPINSQYDLTIDLYAVSGDGDLNYTHLGSFPYPLASALQFLTASIFIGQQSPLTIVATATDANGNTSEFSDESAVFIDDVQPEFVSVGDRVWLDLNNNGLLDQAETGIASVAVNLYEDANLDGVFTPAVDFIVGSTTTDSSGFYRFDGLEPSTYFVQIAPANFNAGGPLAGFVSSTGNSVLGAAPDPDNDVDNDDNGNPAVGLGVISAAVTLALGGEPSGDGDFDSNTNLTVDFGFARTTFVVDIAADESDGNFAPGDLSLREALLLSNGLPGFNTINFNIPGAGPHTIFVGNTGLGPLPNITEAVLIDGYTEPGSAANTNPIDGVNNAVIMIELNGTSAGVANGLEFTDVIGATVRGLAVNRFGNRGIFIEGGANNTIAGNFIGLGPTGVTDVGNADDGVWIAGGDNNVIGGTTPQARNIIAGNGGDGVLITDFGAGNVILGNFIGIDRNRAARPNDGAGVAILDTQTQNNRVGGLAAGEANIINSAGASPGVLVSGAMATGNAIRGNSITVGAGFGIDLQPLAGRTPNDAGDADSGPNRLQNFPVISGNALLAVGQLTVTFSVPTAAASASFPLSIDFYAADAGGNGGRAYLGTQTYSAAEAAVGLKTATFAAAAVTLGDRIVATATDLAGNTSEFSVAALVSNPPLSLGNQVWFDTDNDGLLDAGETGVTGVALNLLTFVDSNGNGVFDPGIDALSAPLQSTMTAVNGIYRFDNLAPGGYLVQVAPSNFAGSGVLVGFASSTGNNVGGVAPSPDNNINSDDNGNPLAGAGVLSGVITLSPRAEPITDGDSDANTNLTLDFGFSRAALVVDIQPDENDGDLSPGDVSLRELILLANSSADFNAIGFNAALSGQAIAITGALPAITASATISAAGLASPVTITAGAANRIFLIDNGAASLIDVVLNNLTLTGGIATGDGALGDGGAILNNENLTLTNVIVAGNTARRGGGVFNGSGLLTLDATMLSGNTATGSYRSGGGVFNDAGDVTIAFSTIAGNTTVGDGGGVLNNTGDVTITSATISGNSVVGSGSDGGGIYNVGGNILVESSTVSGNSASDSGGGVYHLDASRGATTINFSTITQNSARRGGGLAVNTALNVSPTANSANVVLGNSILAGNIGGDVSNVGSYLPSNAGRYVRSQGSNLIGTSNATGAFIAADLTGVANPGLGGLADNGGPTETHALLAGSPAIDAGGLSPLPTFDQRGSGFLRSVDGDDDQNQRADIGAFEFGAGSFLAIGDGDAASWGDFDQNGAVNGADLVSPGVGFCDRFGVDLTGNDFLTWQRNLGRESTTVADAGSFTSFSAALEPVELVLGQRPPTTAYRPAPRSFASIEVALELATPPQSGIACVPPRRVAALPLAWQNEGLLRAPEQVTQLNLRTSEAIPAATRCRWQSTTTNEGSLGDAAWDLALELVATEDFVRNQAGVT